jgi:hypothetical protein
MRSNGKLLQAWICGLLLVPSLVHGAPQGGGTIGTLPPPPVVVGPGAGPGPGAPSQPPPSVSATPVGTIPAGGGAAPVATDPSPTDGGFFLGVNLGVGPNPTAAFESSIPNPTPAFRGGLLIGGQSGRVAFHFGLEYIGGDLLGGGSSSSRFGSMLVWLGSTFAMWRSGDRRAELTGTLRLGPGVAFGFGGSGGPALLMGYQILPGIRYWIHRHVSVLAQAGLGGEYLIRTGSGATVVGLHTLVVSVGPAIVL